MGGASRGSIGKVDTSTKKKLRFPNFHHRRKDKEKVQNCFYIYFFVSYLDIGPPDIIKQLGLAHIDMAHNTANG